MPNLSEQSARGGHGIKKKNMSRAINLIDEKFGRLTVVAYVGIKNRMGTWLCDCDCGTQIEVCTASLRRGRTKSCGCLQKEVATKHGMSRSYTYVSWGAMIQRCTNPNDSAYKYYGERGINVCDSWLKFKNFFRDMGIRPKGLTLDRIDNSLNYSKANCKWATRMQQARNMRCNKMIEYQGKIKCLSEWVDISGIKRSTLENRLDHYPPEIAFNM